MLNLYEQLKEYPEEFIKTIDIVKYENYDLFLIDALKKFNVLDEFNNMPQDKKDGIYELLKLIYVYGFYSGVSFTLNPDKYYEDLQERKKNENSRKDM